MSTAEADISSWCPTKRCITHNLIHMYFHGVPQTMRHVQDTALHDRLTPNISVSPRSTNEWLHFWLEKTPEWKLLPRCAASEVAEESPRTASVLPTAMEISTFGATCCWITRRNAVSMFGLRRKTCHHQNNLTTTAADIETPLKYHINITLFHSMTCHVSVISLPVFNPR